MSERTLTAVLHKEDDLFVAECPEVGTVSQRVGVVTLRFAWGTASLVSSKCGTLFSCDRRGSLRSPHPTQTKSRQVTAIASCR